MIVLLDNYDSFVHNLARYFRCLGVVTQVIRSDVLGPDEILKLEPRAIVLSPGPRTPREAGNSLQIALQLSGRIPILGICLGHQVLAQAFGAQVVVSPQPVHGQASLIWHDGLAEFRDLPDPFLAGRYHSLIVERESLPPDWVVSCWTENGTVMGIRHRQHLSFGWQFHPESILTPVGYRLLSAFLREAGIPSSSIPEDEPLGPAKIDVRRPGPGSSHPKIPLTF